MRYPSLQRRMWDNNLTRRVQPMRSRHFSPWPTIATAALLVASLFIVLPQSASAGSIKPSAPRAVHAVGGDTLASITWTKPVTTGGTITEYVVTARPSNRSVHTPLTNCIIAGLKNGVSYTFTVTATNSVGTGAKSVASNAVTPRGLPGSSSVTEINDSSFNHPNSIASNGTDVWVVNTQGGEYGNGSVSEIDIATGAVTQINDPSFDNPSGISVDNAHVWVTNESGGKYGSGSVSDIDISTGAVTQINDPSFDFPLGISSDGTDVWVANSGNLNATPADPGSISEFDIATGVITQIEKSSIDVPYALASNGTDLWFANGFAQSPSHYDGLVSEMNIANGSITTFARAAVFNPDGIALSSDAAWFNGCGKGGAIPGSDSPLLPIVTTINASSGKATSYKGPLPGCGYSVAVDGTDVWVDEGNNVYEMDSGSGKIMQSDVLGGNLFALDNGYFVMCVDGTDAWIANNQGGASGNGYVTKIAEASS
jgi:Fibronectin type III domain